MVGMETCEGLYEVKMKTCTDSINMVMNLKQKSWHDR